MLQAIGDVLDLGSSYEDQSVGGKLATLAWVPFKLLWGFIVFMVFAWTTSRNGRAFIFAIPAMLFAVFCVALVWIANSKGTQKAGMITRAFYSFSTAPESPIYDKDAALLYARKMVSVDPEHSKPKYELGLSFDRLEEFDRAYDVMKWISEDSQIALADANIIVDDKQARGYSDAHLWLAAYYLNPEKSDLPEEERTTASDEQVQLSYAVDSENVYAVLAMAGVFRRQASELQEEADKLRKEGNVGQADEKDREAFEVTRDAVKYFNEAIDLPLRTDRQLYASIALVEILQDQERDEEARLTGMRFIAKHEKNARDFPNVLPFWVSIVKTCILLEEFERGENYILQGYQLAQDPEVRKTLAQLAAQIAVEKAKSFEDMDDEETFLNRLYALATAIKTDVRVPEGYSQMMYYVDGFETDSEHDLWLRDAILGGPTSESSSSNNNLDPRVPGVIHIVLGLRDIVDGNVKDGQKHWEISGQQFQLAPFAINYFIQVFADERGLAEDKRNELISIAIKMFPQSPHFYATRGRYHLEAKNYEKAIEDLEFANARIPDSKTILENLVQCFKANGNKEKEEKYQAKIDEINARAEIDRISTGFSSEKQEEEDK